MYVVTMVACDSMELSSRPLTPHQWYSYHSGLSGGFAPNKPPCTLTLRTLFDTSPCTKELYSAFGEKGDEGDEGPDKNTGLRVGSLSMGVEVGFHEGFLDDEDPNTPRSTGTCVL